MSAIEDELLALAGGNESSDEEEEVMSDRESRDESASPPPAKKGSARDGSRRAPAKRGRKRSDDESDEEEGEASSQPGSPNSIGSAAMEESDSENENVGRAAGDDDDEKYPVDGMFTSQAEKSRIMALREVERESILAERTTEIERQRQNRMLRQLVSKQENEEKKAMKIRKRTASSADLEDDDRKSARQRTETKTSSGIDTLRRARAEKNDRARAREENRRSDKRSPHRGRRGSSVASSRVSYDDKGRSPSPKVSRELPPPGIRDFERIRVGRSRFAQYCFNPGFEEALTGCYVRVSLGPDPSGVDQYRMAKIKAFNTGRPYAITGPGGSFVTDQYVLVQHGKSPKEFAFIFCSDKPFSEREFNRYVTVMSNDGLPLPKTQQLLNKIDDINRFVGRSLTNDEIGEKVERKRKLRYKFDPERRERLVRELEEAKLAGKTSQAQEIQDELDDMQSNRLAFRTSLSSQAATVVTSQQDRLADINRERRRQNAANVGKAQLKEKAEARRREQALERENANKLSAATSLNGTPKIGPKDGDLLPHIAKALESARKADKKGMPSIHRPICDDDIIANIDLDLDIEID